MTSPDKPQKFADKLVLRIRNNFTLLVGLIVGIFLTIVMVLASGFMIETTNKDTFCVSCHISPLIETLA